MSEARTEFYDGAYYVRQPLRHISRRKADNYRIAIDSAGRTASLLSLNLKLAHSGTQTKKGSHLTAPRLVDLINAPGKTRTCGLLIRSRSEGIFSHSLAFANII
jgi:hypothetical protein